MTTCRSCASPLAPGARFCRSCGTEVAAGGTTATATTAVRPCPSCGHEAPGGGRFCRQCGSALAAEPVPEPPPVPCELCGRPAATGAKFCADCAGAGAADVPEPATLELPPPPPPAARPPGAPPPPPGPPPPAAGAPVARPRRRRGFAVALVLAALLLAGGGAAVYFLVLEDDPKPVAAKPSRPAPPEPIVDPEPEPAPEPAPESRPEPDPTPAPDPGPRFRPGSPQAVLYSHWKAIDAGRYEDAAALFHSAYVRPSFAAEEREFRPDVDLESFTATRRGGPSGEVQRLDVEVVLVDRVGDYAGNCRLFSGWTRMQREGGRWRYRPGEVDGVEPSFGITSELPPDDPRCRRLN